MTRQRLTLLFACSTLLATPVLAKPSRHQPWALPFLLAKDVDLQCFVAKGSPKTCTVKTVLKGKIPTTQHHVFDRYGNIVETLSPATISPTSKIHVFQTQQTFSYWDHQLLETNRRHLARSHPTMPYDRPVTCQITEQKYHCNDSALKITVKRHGQEYGQGQHITITQTHRDMTTIKHFTLNQQHQVVGYKLSYIIDAKHARSSHTQIIGTHIGDMVYEWLNIKIADSIEQPAAALMARKQARGTTSHSKYRLITSKDAKGNPTKIVRETKIPEGWKLYSTTYYEYTY